MPEWRRIVERNLGDLSLDPAREAEIVEELAQQLEDVYQRALLRGASEEEAVELADAEVADWGALRKILQRIESRPPSRSTQGARSPRARPEGTAGFFPRSAGGGLGDLRFGLRYLARRPGPLLAAVLTVALGVGVNSAVFSVIEAVLLRPLPYPDEDRLVSLYGVQSEQAESMFRVSEPDYRDIRDKSTSFEAIALGSYWTFNVKGPDLTERILGVRVTGDFFRVLGTPALIGRTLGPDDDKPDSPEAVVLSYGLWERMFGGRPDVLGETIGVNSRPHVIVGVMPRGFAFPADDVEMWGAIAGNMSGVPRHSRFLFSVARLAKGLDLGVAQSEMDALSKALQQSYPDTNRDWAVRLRPLREALVGGFRRPLWLLQCAVGVVLLVGCANLAALLVAQSASRRAEIAVRQALGASRWRLVRQRLVENLLLAGTGGVLGLGLAWALSHWFKANYPGPMPQLWAAGLSVGVLVFTIGVSAAVGIVLAVACNGDLRRGAVKSVLAGDRSGSQAKGTLGLHRLLVAAETALTLLLLVGGGLLLSSFVRLVSVDPGFRKSDVLTFNVFLTSSPYGSTTGQNQYIRAALERIESVPGVVRVGATSHMPLKEGSTSLKFEIEGSPVPFADAPLAAYRSVSSDYFETLDVPLLEGRGLSENDQAESPRVLLVNHRLARRHWPGESPVGKRLRWIDPQLDVGWLTVVGVVEDVRAFGLDQEDVDAVYIPYRQRTLPFLRWTAFAARTAGQPMAYWPMIREALLKLDPSVPVYEVKDVETLIRQSVAEPRFNAWVVGVLALASLSLALIGIYGVVSYATATRTREMAIRMALGARPADVARLVTVQGMLPVAAGALVGVAGSLLLTRFLESRLYEVTPTDPWVFGGGTALLCLAALAACLIPSHRASRLSLVEALRYQ